ncbi:MAG TPA: farnesyl diphosphate synthase [candidate division Zixibacteria bacterium]|nr:farnesyl diphosphate synthase [candidate division Zixibacteria bacterium]
MAPELDNVANRRVIVEPPFLSDLRRMVDEHLDQRLPSPTEHPAILHEAIRYSALARAKRIRPALALTVYETLGGAEIERALPPCCALELVHTYSLIHDDLPSMDNDDLRRGLPTLHKKYNEGIAVLAGDALHDLAFAWTAQAGNTQLVIELAEAIGSFGMIGGQVADMEAEGRPVSEEDILFIHRQKTAALIRCAARFGALLAGDTGAGLAAVSRYGAKLGLAFQIVDDILDIEGDQAKLGKSVGSDQKNLKATYPAAVGMERSHEAANKLIDEAIEALSGAEFPTERLIELARYIGRRES